MAKNATLTVRINESLKADVEVILEQLGLNTSEVINLLMHQIRLHKSLPLSLHIPNTQTHKAIETSARGIDVTEYDSIDDVIDDIDNW